jgi:hypothetical protein
VLTIFICAGLLSHASVARAQFSTDAPILAEILANALKQLYEMQQIVQNGQDTFGLIDEINRGVNDSIRTLETLGVHIDPGVYHDLSGANAVLAQFQKIYGSVAKSPDEGAQRNTDQVVAEAISANNDLYASADQLDQIGEEIKGYSHRVSPGGAQKLTAQSLGVLIQVMNQQVRATATGLKISAQALAMQNKREKASTSQYLTEVGAIKAALQGDGPKFEFPKF